MADWQSIALRTLEGVTTKKADALNSLGLHVIHDLLYHFPFRHEDLTVRSLMFVADGEKITVRATVAGTPQTRYLRAGKTMVRCKLEVDGTWIHGVWFNRNYVANQLKIGHSLLLSGKWDAKYRQINVSEHQTADRQPVADSEGGLTPVYSTVSTLPQKWLRERIAGVVTQYAGRINDPLPESLLSRNQLPSLAESIRNIHLPPSADALKRARERLIYDEFFHHQIKMQAYRSWNKRKRDGIAHVFSGAELQAFKDRLPFQLTKAQQRVLREIMLDLREPFAMNRLVQGDVGAGKTVVAAFAMYAVVCAGAQAVLMAPTEILAEQHARSLSAWLTPFGIAVERLTGSTSSKQRRSIIDGLRMGLIQIAVGTHALIQDDVYFQKLGLIVTDEQHRFGVNQRTALRNKGLNPDVLSMTATPIPRTLAITAFGDLDVSILDELPKGRIPIITKWLYHKQFAEAKQLMLTEMTAGRQAYLICPLIEESDKLDVQDAVDMYESLVHEWRHVRIGLLHGKMSNQEKDEAMRAFKEGETQLLVSTTVIEVGVDVPNATCMVIYDADRFGLAQLHQLRGRVGRGQQQSFCMLIADPKTEVGEQRLEMMCASNDGFEIARKDLELRGSGDLFGTRQSGLPQFKLADMMRDFAVLEKARQDVADLLADEHFWTSHQYVELRKLLRLEEWFDAATFD